MLGGGALARNICSNELHIFILYTYQFPSLFPHVGRPPPSPARAPSLHHYILRRNHYIGSHHVTYRHMILHQSQTHASLPSTPQHSCGLFNTKTSAHRLCRRIALHLYLHFSTK